MNMVNKRNHGKWLKEKVVRKISLRRRHMSRDLKDMKKWATHWGKEGISTYLKIKVKLSWLKQIKAMDFAFKLRKRLCHVGFPGGSDGKEFAPSAGDLGLIPRLGRSPGKGSGNPLQYSCLGNWMDRGAWWATVHGVAKSLTQLRDWVRVCTQTQSIYCLTHSDNNGNI